MAANFLHGVETVEVTKGGRPIKSVKTAVIGLVGTAPIFAVAQADRKINVPVLCSSEVDDAKYFGADKSGFTIPAALDAIRDQGSGLVVVVNVFDPDTHKTDAAETSKTFNADDQISLGHFGITALVVKSSDGNTTYVLDTDYTVDTINGVITRKGSNIAAGATVKVAYTYADPSKALAADIIGEVTAGGDRTGLKALKDSYGLFGFNPKLIIAPAYCTQASVVAEMESTSSALRAMAIVDAPSATTLADAIAGRGAEGEINFNTSSERTILCYPHVKIYDAATDSEILAPLSPRVAGLMAAKDLAEGYWVSPSNTQIKGIIGMERSLTAMINDPTSEVNQLNEVGISTIFNSFGTGLRLWGNRTAAWPAVAHPKNFIAVRRVADVINESIEYAMLEWLDQPINNALIDGVLESVNGFLRTLASRGAILDGKAWFDQAKNTATEIAAGHLVFDYDFMPPVPAERVSFDSFINIDYLKSLGGK